MRKGSFFLALLILGYLSQLMAANYKFNHVDVPRTIVLEETGDVLSLRGAAVHKNFLKNKYIGAFYSHNPLSNAKEALVDPGPKRMWLYFLEGTNNLKNDWEGLIEENNSPDLVEKEQIEISQFLKMIDVPLQRGDSLVLDYMPNVGTKVTLKGSVRGILKENEFYHLLLKSWMGRQPPSEKFQKDLFNLS